jgi:hypothetical protein
MRISTFRVAVIAAAVALAVPSISFAADQGGSDSGDPPQTVHMSFTKYATINPGGGVMQGVVKGDVAGPFVGYVFSLQQSGLVAQQAKLGVPVADVFAIQALYEVDADRPSHSLRALIQGGQDINSNAAILDGTVLGGWLTGEHAHVQFKALPCSQSDLGTQPNALNGTCYQGTLTIGGDN